MVNRVLSKDVAFIRRPCWTQKYSRARGGDPTKINPPNNAETHIVEHCKDDHDRISHHARGFRYGKNILEQSSALPSSGCNVHGQQFQVKRPASKQREWVQARASHSVENVLARTSCDFIESQPKYFHVTSSPTVRIIEVAKSAPTLAILLQFL